MYMNTPTWPSHTSVDFPQSIIEFYKRLRQFSPIARFRSDSNRRINSFAGCHLRPLGHRTRKSLIQRVQLPRIDSPPTTSYIFRSINPSSVEVLRSHASFTNQLATLLAIIGRTFVLQEGIEPSLPGYSQCASIPYTATCFGQVNFYWKQSEKLWTVICRNLIYFLQIECPEWDLNSYVLVDTSTSTMRVYRFHHLGIFKNTSLLPESNRWPSYYE